MDARKLTEAEAWAGIADVIQHAPEALVYRPLSPDGSGKPFEGLCSAVWAMYFDGAIGMRTRDRMQGRIRDSLEAKLAEARRAEARRAGAEDPDAIGFLHNYSEWRDGVRLGIVLGYLKASQR